MTRQGTPDFQQFRLARLWTMRGDRREAVVCVLKGKFRESLPRTTALGVGPQSPRSGLGILRQATRTANNSTGLSVGSPTRLPGDKKREGRCTVLEGNSKNPCPAVLKAIGLERLSPLSFWASSQVHFVR